MRRTYNLFMVKEDKRYGDAELAQQMKRMLSTRSRRSLADSSFRHAAVLVPFVDGANGWQVLFIQRADRLGKHGGQMAFPGGAIDPTDADAIAAALREVREEIGIGRDQIDVWGLFDDFGPTSSGFYATPVVAELMQTDDFDLNLHEVQALVKVPLSFFLDPANVRVEMRETAGLPRQNFIWEYAGFTIWGFTSRILHGLLQECFGFQPAPDGITTG